MSKESFDWDIAKDLANQEKHGLSFAQAQYAFADPNRIIATVRFTYRDNIIRIFGAGYWRKGKRIYEHENQVHK